MGLREDILQTEDLDRERVHVPEWDVDLYVRGLTAAERDDWESELIRMDGAGEVEIDRSNTRANLVVRCVVDEDGNRVFSDTDAERLGDKNGRAVDRLFDVAQRLSGISDEDVDDLAGKSESDLPAGSLTG